MNSSEEFSGQGTARMPSDVTMKCPQCGGTNISTEEVVKLIDRIGPLVIGLVLLAGSGLIVRDNTNQLWGLGMLVMALWFIWDAITMKPILGIKLMKVRTVTRCKCAECGHKWLLPEEIAAVREQLPPVPRPAEARPSKLARDAEADERIKSLIQTLRSKKLFKTQTNWDAAKELGELGDARAVEPLIEALEDRQILVRVESAKALGKIRDTRAVEPLIDALPSVPVPASEALGEIGDERALEPLAQYMVNAPPSVRKAAEEAIKKIESGRT